MNAVNVANDFADKVWFLPFRDAALADSPEVRAAMRLMKRDPYVKAKPSDSNPPDEEKTNG